MDSLAEFLEAEPGVLKKCAKTSEGTDRGVMRGGEIFADEGFAASDVVDDDIGKRPANIDRGDQPPPAW